MAQIKYIAFAFLLLLFGFFSITAIQKISSVEFIKSTEPSQGFFCGTVMNEPNDPLTAKGRTLFKANCASCHALDKVLSGPALRGVMTRGPWAEDKKNFKKWVRNPAAFILTNPYTNVLHKQYGMTMPSFSSSLITDEDLDEVYKYLDASSVIH